MKLLRAHRYLFYRIYLWRRNREEVGAAFVATTTVGLFLILNLGAALSIVEAFFDVRLVDLASLPAGTITGFLLGFGVAHVVLLRNTGAIVAEFSNESADERQKRGLIVIVYVVTSIVAYVVGWLGMFAK